MIKLKNIALITLLFSATLTSADEKQEKFSHDLFQQVISTHVDNGFVDYPAIDHNADYHHYLTNLEAVTPLHGNSEQLSYWINAYNALAIKGILDGRSPLSFFGKIGYFYNAEYKVNGKTINLYDLEHDLIIPLSEPRIHFALNCASVSCPKLSNNVYRVNTLEQQLEQAAIEFINDKTRNQFDYGSKIAHLSEIFNWFAEDFEKHSGSVQNYLALYVTDAKVSNALANNEFEIKYMEYDWTLNGKPVGQDK